MLSPFEIFTDCTQAHLDANRDWLQPRFQDPTSGLLAITIQSFLIRQNGLTILVDSCSGNDKEARARPHFLAAQWPWLDRLREAGVKPEDIDIVLCSHLHVDHVGWNTRLDNGRWVPTFPNARYLIGAARMGHWQDGGPGGARSHRRLHHRQRAADVRFRPGRADRRRACARQRHLGRARARPHARGRSMVRLGSGREQAILSADLMHHPLQVRYPDWSTRFCIDPVQAREPASSFFNEHADTGRLIFPAHFPSPTGGTIERDGKDFRFHLLRASADAAAGSRGHTPYNCSKLLTLKAI